MAASKETVHLRLEKRVAWITLDRPPLNVLDIPLMRALDAALERALPQCDFIVFQGAGTKGFSAGAEIADHAPERVEEMLAAFHAIFRRLVSSDCLTIAAVHGVCLGGGMELATFCDFLFAADSAQFGQPEIKLGCFPPVAMVILPRLIGLRAATDLILSGRQISAAEAAQLGLVTRNVPDARLHSAVEALLGELQQLSPAVLKLTRNTLRRIHLNDFGSRLREVEQVYLKDLLRTQDAHEGVLAFLEKRPPVWKGR